MGQEIEEKDEPFTERRRRGMNPERAKLHHVSEGGLSAEVLRDPPEEVVVAPATKQEKNTIRLPLEPIGCWRLDDPRFSFDSSFLLPEAREEFVALGKLRETMPGAPMTIFGHADPVGNDDYNKRLSGRRAEAVYAVLTRSAAMWEALYTHPHGEDRWGMREVQTMLAALGYETGKIDGIQGPVTTAAVKEFQKDRELQVDGIVGPFTRKELFLGYMDLLCGGGEGGKAYVVAKSGFLGRGADAKGKGDYQGCGEFNPVMLFSAAEQAAYQAPEKRAERNQENTPNRRIVIYFFHTDMQVAPKKWPCPRTEEGTALCKVRLFSDAAARRSFREERREWAKTRDTFACRFYQRLVMESACERLHGAVPLLVKIVDHLGHPVDMKPFTVVVADAEKDVTTTEEGMLSTLMPRGDVALEIDGERSVFFGDGYEFYTHDKVKEFEKVSPYPFAEDPGSKNGRSQADLVEDLTAALAAMFGEGEE